jgi:cytochrome c oxidase assembly protein subunit 15
MAQTRSSTAAQAHGGAGGVASGRLGTKTRRLLLANLVAQVVIVVSGGLVRLTGSGLGCPQWPECTKGSLVPVTNQPQGFHKFIEFGNRTLTFVLVAIAVAALVATVVGVRRQAHKRWRLVGLAAAVIAGIFGQAVIGGIAVYTGLNPLVVAAHLLLSVGIIAAAFLLWHLAGEPAGPYRVVVRQELRAVAWLLVVLAVGVIVLGTIVTGSGPHSGDSGADHRLPFDPRYVSWLHADVVLLFIGLAVAFWLGARLTAAPPAVLTRAHLLLAALVAQALLGYTQFFTGLPWGLVAMHMLGAMLIWLATLSVLLSTRRAVGDAESAAV